MSQHRTIALSADKLVRTCFFHLVPLLASASVPRRYCFLALELLPLFTTTMSLSAMHLEALLSNAKMQNLKVAECFISKVQRIQIRNVYIPAYGATLGQLGHPTWPRPAFNLVRVAMGIVGVLLLSAFGWVASRQHFAQAPDKGQPNEEGSSFSVSPGLPLHLQFGFGGGPDPKPDPVVVGPTKKRLPEREAFQKEFKEAEANCKKEKKELKDAQKELKEAEAKVEKAEAKVEKAKKELEKAEAKLEKAKKELEKAEATGTKDVIKRAKQMFYMAVKGANSVQAGVDSAQAGVDFAQARVNNAQVLVDEYCCVQKKRIAFPLILSWEKSGNAVTSSRNVMLSIKSLHKSLQNSNPKTSFIELLSFFHRLLCTEKKNSIPAHSELGKERECCYIFSKCHVLNKISAQKFAKQQSKNEFHRIADCCVQKKRIAFPLILSWGKSGNAVTSSRNVMLLIKSLHKSLIITRPFFHTFKFQTGPRKILRLKALTGSYVFGIQLILLVCQRVGSLSDSGMSTKHIAKTLQAILKNSRGELFLKINGSADVLPFDCVEIPHAVFCKHDLGKGDLEELVRGFSYTWNAQGIMYVCMYL
eukprot:g13787.t1